MRRALLLTPHIGSGYLTKGKVYDIERIDFHIYNEELEKTEFFDYETITVEQKSQGYRDIYIIDDRGEEEELLEEYEDEKYIIFENDKDLAHYLIDNIEGLDLALINMKKML